MKINIEFPDNDICWENNAVLRAYKCSKDLISIEANKAGLISLAKHFLSLAYATDKDFNHFHYWPEAKNENGYMYGDLDEGSDVETFILRVDEVGFKKGC